MHPKMDNMATLKANVFSFRTQNGLKMKEAVAVSNVITFHSLFENTRPSAFIPLKSYF
jgi:hypothetical protein